MNLDSPARGHFQRGLILQEQRRYRDAERCFREALGSDPQDVMALYHLAICQMQNSESAPEALATIERAIGLDPENAYFRALKSLILCLQEKKAEALRVADEALALDPQCGLAFNARATALLQLARWPEAEQAARASLALDPENATTANHLAQALRMQNKMAENAEQIRGMLQRDPEDPQTHSSAGWSALQRGDYREAETHFLEALRLAPDSEGARHGLIEAFKARSPFYRAYLKYCFFMARLSGKSRWAVVLGLYFGVKFSALLLGRGSSLYWGVIVLYLVLVLWVHLARGTGNLLVLADRRARHALKRKEKWEAIAVGGGVMTGIFLLVGGFATQFEALTILGAGLIGAAVPFAYTFTNDSRFGKRLFGGFAAFVLFSTVLLAATDFSPEMLSSDTTTLFAGISFVLVIATTWLANVRFLNR